MLTLVPTPVGNLEDITLRALRILREADCIAAEDTRHAAILLKHHAISRPLVSLHEHNEAQRADEIARRLAAGENIALLTDAGTPGISDPGFRVVRECIARGLEFTVLPGPGQHGEFQSACDALAHHAEARIGDAGRSRIGEQRDVFPRGKASGDLVRTLRLVMLVQADQRAADGVVFEQDSRVTCVFRGDAVGFAQDAQGAQGDILQIPDGSGDESQQGIKNPRSSGWPA